MAESPLVSVIMTVYNGERYLSQAIESIRRQSLPDFEFVIVDDGSDDTTPDILINAQLADPRIKPISSPRLGRAAALNKAWTHANGLYIANLDADDMAEPARLERQASFLQANSKIGLLGSAWRVLYVETGKEDLQRPPLTDCELRKALVRGNPFQHSSIMMPKFVLNEVGGYNEDLLVSIDYELWVRIGCRYNLANLPDVLTVKRIHRDAYFKRFTLGERYRTHAVIRWQAWRQFSLPLADMRFIVHPNRLPRKFIARKFPKFAALYRSMANRPKPNQF